MPIIKLSNRSENLNKQASKYFLTVARLKLSPFYSETELRNFHDPKFKLERITKRVEIDCYLVARNVDRAINGGLLGTIQYEDGQAAGLIDIVSVSQPRVNFGRNLVKTFEKEVREKVDFYAAWIKEENTISRSFFESIGYHHDGQHQADKTVCGYYKDLTS